MPSYSTEPEDSLDVLLMKRSRDQKAMQVICFQMFNKLNRALY